jgi:hypothetical protein
MDRIHDAPTAGHPGRDETIRQTKLEGHHWQGMNRWIANYIQGCATCQANKILTHRKKTPTYKITVPQNAKPFQQISMDLIMGLPKSNTYDAILTIVDHRCTRAALFLPCHTTITGPGIVQLYLEHVYRWFGLPTKVISDRDPRFTSHFGRGITKAIGITQNLSTTAHPQTDGSSERANQWVEQFLRLITTWNPQEWAHWLPVATAVYNNRRNSTTKLAPNQALLGYHPAIRPEQNSENPNQSAQKRIELLRKYQDEAKRALNATAEDKKLQSQYAVNQQPTSLARNNKSPNTTKIKTQPQTSRTILDQETNITSSLSTGSASQLDPS